MNSCKTRRAVTAVSNCLAAIAIDFDEAVVEDQFDLDRRMRRQELLDDSIQTVLPQRDRCIDAQDAGRLAAHALHCADGRVVLLQLQPGVAVELPRLQLNDWLRTARLFDAVVDFDAVLRDLRQPRRLRPEYDSGGHLHPGDAGYRAMAEAIDIAPLLANRRP